MNDTISRPELSTVSVSIVTTAAPAQSSLDPDNLMGEYLKLGLLGTAACSLCYWLLQISHSSLAPICAVLNGYLIFWCTSKRFTRSLRITLDVVGIAICA
jgi:hypothetical protein